VVFPAEFLNRLGDVIVFHFLTELEVQQIADKFIGKLQRRMLEKRIELDIHKNVINKLAKDGFNAVYGARPLLREIEKQLENPIAAMIVKNECRSGCCIRIKVEKGNIWFHMK
jgi:ATP-dependent Clp protease ATP-binding subunit ClpC